MKKTEQKNNMHVFKTAKEIIRGGKRRGAVHRQIDLCQVILTLIICRVKAEALCRQDTGVMVIVELAKHLHTAQTNAL